MSKLYWVLGPFLLVGYTLMETRGVVFSGTDRPAGAYAATSGGRRSPGAGPGIWIFGTGYRGGK